MKYVFLSAVLFVIPDFYPWLSIPCTFIFLVPLFTNSSLSCTKGLSWGLVVCSVKCSWFLMLLTTKRCGGIDIVPGFFLWLCTILWMSLFSAAWFWAITKFPRIAAMLLSTIMFFCVMIFGCMVPFGVLEGYPFFNPLVPLAQYPAMLWSVQRVGFLGIISFLIMLQMFFARWLAEKKTKDILLTFLCLLPFFLGPFFYQPTTIPVHDIHYIKPWWYGCSNNPAFVGYAIVDELARVATDLPIGSVILMPESTFCFELDDHKEFVSLWSSSARDATILFGGHRRIKDIVLNSFVMVQDGKVVHVYDKQHLMPFIERSVEFFGCAHKKHSSADDLICLNRQAYQVFMCSELFFESKKVKGYPIILIANESWLCCDYMKKLAVLFIQYFELKYNKPVLYATTQGMSNV